jgi:C4-dicarboxylate-specific signal transduction histidine kinase
MAVGQPILATDVGGIREVVTAPLLDSSDVELQACGVVLPPRDVRAMAEAIELLISDHDLFEEYARNATARLDRLYHIDVTLAQYNELYAGFGVTSTPRSRALTPALREVRAAVGTTASQGTTSTAGTAIASTNPGHEPSHVGRGRHARRQRRHGLPRDQRQEAVPTR